MQIELKDVPLGGTFRVCERHTYRAEASALYGIAIASIDDGQLEISKCRCSMVARWTHAHPLRAVRLCGFSEEQQVDFDPLVDALTQSFS